jgi:DUF4097 and DUF4098 domain-containing protein YvlB
MMSIVRKVVSMSIVALASAGVVRADRSISESVAADNAVVVSVELVAGDVEVVAWDEPRVTVEGTIGDDVEEVEIEGHGARVEIVVKIPDGSGRKGTIDADAHLDIRVPRGAEVQVESLSADMTIKDVRGDVHAETVSGDVTVETRSKKIEAGVVSGDLRIAASGGELTDLAVDAVSGDVTVEGVSGSANVQVVSGDLHLEGSVSHAEIEAVSGDVKVAAGFMPGAQVEINTVSGTVELSVAAGTSARFRVDTFSGGIETDFGTPTRADEYGPGMELDATAGSGDARVEIESFSGTVKIRKQ